MTWAEFKAFVEKSGVTDDMRISRIDVVADGALLVSLPHQWKASDMSTWGGDDVLIQTIQEED